MPIFRLFSKRQRKRKQGPSEDTYAYDRVPERLRVQVIQIWKDALGKPEGNQSADNMYSHLQQILCREYGKFRLCERRPRSAFGDLASFLLETDDYEEALDVIEITFRAIDRLARDDDYREKVTLIVEPDEAIGELNARFDEEGLGYQFENGLLVRRDDELLHAEVVRPALRLLSSRRYSGPNEEFTSAHEHYRHGRYKECLNDCLKCFESTMKAICDARRWKYDADATASQLIKLCVDKGLLPGLHEAHLNAIASEFQSGIPTLRNKLAAHGQGRKRKSIGQHYAAYAIHLTATTVKFLIEAEKCP